MPTSRSTRYVCPKCGYDVRGLPTPTCPECGSDLRETGVRDRLAGPSFWWQLFTFGIAVLCFVVPIWGLQAVAPMLHSSSSHAEADLSIAPKNWDKDLNYDIGVEAEGRQNFYAVLGQSANDGVFADDMTIVIGADRYRRYKQEGEPSSAAAGTIKLKVDEQGATRLVHLDDQPIDESGFADHLHRRLGADSRYATLTPTERDDLTTFLWDIASGKQRLNESGNSVAVPLTWQLYSVGSSGIGGGSQWNGGVHLAAFALAVLIGVGLVRLLKRAMRAHLNRF